MTTKTKAELEDEIGRLKARVSELEGAVAAYQFALEQAAKNSSAFPYYPYYPVYPNSGDVWKFPQVTWVSTTTSETPPNYS